MELKHLYVRNTATTATTKFARSKVRVAKRRTLLLCGGTVRLQPNRHHLLDVRTIALYRAEFLELQKSGRIRLYTTALQPYTLRSSGPFLANAPGYAAAAKNFERPPELMGEVRYTHLPEHKEGHFVHVGAWQTRNPVDDYVPPPIPLGGSPLPPEPPEPAEEAAPPLPHTDLPPEVPGSEGEEDDFGELLDRPVARPPVPMDMMADPSEEEAEEPVEEKTAAPPPEAVRGRKKRRR